MTVVADPMTPAQWVTAFLNAGDETREIQALQVIEYRATILRLRAELAQMTIARDVFVEFMKEAEAERDSLAEQVKRATDLKLIRLAISDPGAFVKREQSSNGDYETVPAWGARAVVLAVKKGGEQRG